ncbi:uncharacterized protein Z519_05671 [Cladophialophora bantiana CBS 173.52]|uniref:Xylanolytic transcriptional activator regulatory domain-containing protein n=1 Tax=Cladophialophora bantiana (strain ATCC 10958 / CBS 173.52 / CDC B-1940 / NIH 8579) TaxID=1442370 RepID=A0A0D2HU10_CLAB1|nr:uncharacterized protein Z519_05671 [Cladophialophora bantiana CBS 173.52]KIW94355.1 hypothetical protein Z519_05671 [Cladophialophora bantiana CBS 173.52]
MSSKSIAPIEIGSFTASTPEKTEFIGSASGVFFVNTVFRAFAGSAYSSKALAPNEQSTQNDPGSVDSRLVDPDTPMQPDHEALGMRILIENETGPNSYGVKGHGLGVAPEQESAKELLVLYLKNWHPLFPFLHGPTLYETIRALYETDGPRKLSLRSRLCHAIICQCVFNIAALDQPEGTLALESRLDSPAKLLSLLGYVASNHDNRSLQALLAAQLYLVATMSLRAASTIGGTLTRVMFHAGFHRCAFRYPQLSPHECDLRKRIFWSAYVLDRYLSQALGHPLGIQDSDLDVCIPGMDELHKPVKTSQQVSSASREPAEGVLAHLPRGHRGRESRSEEATGPEDAGGPATGSDLESSDANSPNDVNISRPSHTSQILGHYVLYCRLTGQALEIFHISLQNRTINAERMMELQSNVHAWWNGLPQELQDEYTGDGVKLASTFTFFFSILYNHLLLLSNRPFLSLSPKSLEFKSSLQTCIAASRQIITTSRRQHERGLVVSWPGMLSATWMAGLVLAFACTLKRYPFSKAQREIQDSICSLSAMAKSWNNARHCAEALQSLLETLTTQYNGRLSALTSPPSSSSMGDPGTAMLAAIGGPTEPIAPQLPLSETNEPCRKRKRTSQEQQRQNRPQGELPDVRNGRSNQSQTINQDFDQLPSLNSGAMFPILEYTGPDFGFSNGQYPTMDDFEFLGLPVSDDLYPNNPGAFGNIGWEAMANGSGNMQSWAVWGTPKY